MNYITVRNLFQFSVFAFLLMCFTDASAQLKGDTYAAAKSKGTANWVLTYAEAPGFASKRNGAMSGITVDLMNEFKKYVEQKHGIQVNMSYEAKDPNNFTLFLDEVKKGQGGVFGLSNTTITEARKKEYKFSPPYITNIGMILTHNSVPTVNDISEIGEKFAGMTAVTIKNSTNEKIIKEIKAKHFPGMTIEYVPSFGEAMQKIINDPKKFANVDFTYYFEAIQNRLPVKRHPGGDQSSEQFGIIMPKSNDWAPLLEEFMNSFVGSVEYKKIVANNLGQSAMKFLDTLKK